MHNVIGPSLGRKRPRRAAREGKAARLTEVDLAPQHDNFKCKVGASSSQDCENVLNLARKAIYSV